jgi:hypothetical protein
MLFALLYVRFFIGAKVFGFLLNDSKAPPPKPAGNSKLTPFYQEPKAEEIK